jgi:small subunit ribosomal protein S7
MRRKIEYKREYQLDPKYQNQLVGRFINQLMRRGKKSVAQRVVYQAFELIERNQKQSPLSVFEQAIKNTSPLLEVRSKRVGGANYQVPVEVRGERKITLSMRWILQAARSKKGKAMFEKLAEELVQAAGNEGAAVKKKSDVQKMAEANRAFAHFAR